MTTATQEKTEERAPTMAEIERQEATLREVSDEISSLGARAEALSAEIADAIADQEDPEELRTERREVRQERADLEEAAAVLAQRIQERRRERLTERARERLQAIKKKAGGLCGEAPRRAEEARELTEKLVKRLDWLAHARFRRKLLGSEASMLAQGFGLDVPELKRLEEHPMEAVERARRAVGRISAPRAGALVQLDVEGAARLLRQIFDEESPAPKLLRALDALEEAADAEPERQEKAS